MEYACSIVVLFTSGFAYYLVAILKKRLEPTTRLFVAMGLSVSLC